MKKLNKEQKQARTTLVNKLNELQENVEDAVNKYNEAVQEGRALFEEIVDEMDEYINSKSEKWAESAAAEKYEEWKSEYENFTFDDLEEPQFVDTEELDALPDSPDEG
jgi:hypothetical protein